MSFAHLHCHSEYSPLDGISKPKDLARRAKELGQPAIAITDHGTMGGAIELYEACQEQGIKAIVGFEAYVTPDRFVKEKDAYEKIHYHLILLAMNNIGYRNLLALMTESFGEGYYYKPRIDRALLEQYNEGLIVLSGCLGGELAQHLLHDDEAAARETIAWYRSVFEDRYYVELQDHDQDDDRVYLSKVVPLARELQVPVVATGDSHYNLKEDADTAEIIHAMQSQATLADEKRFRLNPKDAYYIKSTEEMVALFGHIEGAIENTLVIAERCTLEIELGGRLPFPDTTHVTGQDSPLGWLTTTCYDAMNALCSKLGRTYPEEYYARLEYELSIIEQTGFAEYLILVYDFVKWARDRGIPSVPRGSAAGSLLLYLLGVSDIDPIEYGLTFERFLNPERVQMPDVDMDFSDERRGEIFEYLVSRYGREHVAQISTYAQIKAKSAVRDAAGVLGWEHTDKMRLSGMIPDLPANITLAECLEKVADLKKMYETDLKVRTVLNLALAIEGKLRTQGNHNLGVHAAGTIISGDPIHLHAPLQPPNRKDKVVVTQYSQKVLEHLGLLKMDVLGLSNLTMVERCVNLIAEHRGEQIDIRHIPDRDPATFAMLQRGETSTVFQLAGGAMTKYLKQLVPDQVRHLIAMVALYRPGPMQLIPSFIKRRHGHEEVAYLHPDLEPILGETYGVLVYQDQVLQILEKIAGYTKGQADIVRRAMGKKEVETMAAEKERFLEGARARGYEEIASELWDEIEPHCGYSFNRAHACCYGMLAYQTAYLKAHYPVEWTAAVLQTSNFKPDDLPPLIAEARDRALPLLAPDVNQSFVRFAVEEMGPGPHGGRGLRYGLGAVKQVGETAAEAIVREREQHGPYRSLDDLIRRSNTSIVTAKTLEYLTKAGAFDAFGSRESILATLPAIGKALSSYKGKITRRKNSGKALDDVELETIPLVETFTPSASQYLDWELEALGLFLSDHPFARMAGRIETTPIAAALEEVEQEIETARRQGQGHKPRSREITAAVSSVREITTKVKKEKMAIVVLSDLSGTVEGPVFPSVYRENPELWRVGSIVRVTGKIGLKDDRLQFVVDVGEACDDLEGGTDVAVVQTLEKPERLDDTTEIFLTARELAVRLRESDGGLGDLKRNQKVLSLLQRPGSTPYRIVVEDRQGERRVVSPVGATVRLTRDLVEQMTWLLGEENVRVVA